ncbi:MAG: ATP-binding cassette domain-containing protein [Nitrososphaeria archaeon]|nr:ATP-binding cassette domain-containing protein [Nitrososphaeria archaeon]NIN53283.1 ATP-binding cassette domain-containing protein [Nitrososphaeria archaeon]NIQ33734.1 ATP-binding cassette domain-containing protein [Nitrososphaeria archaeon]
MSIEVEKVSSGYFGDYNIIHNWSMKAEKSKITAVIGPNGCGKSTLMKTVYGILKPREGKISYGDEDITGFEPHEMLRKGIAYIPQARSIFPYLTVYENLKMGAWLYRKDKNWVEEAIERIQKMFPILEEREKVNATSLSGGEQKMLEIGRALIPNPEVVIVDEPTAGLAPKIAHEIYTILDGFKEKGLTVLMVDQNVRQAILFSDYLYVMEMGGKANEGPREKFEEEMKDLIQSWI